MVWKQLRYLICPGSVWGPWIRLLATSNGMFTQDDTVPDTKPIANFLINSSVGSWYTERTRIQREKKRECVVFVYKTLIVTSLHISCLPQTSIAWYCNDYLTFFTYTNKTQSWFWQSLCISLFCDNVWMYLSLYKQLYDSLTGPAIIFKILR